MCYSMYYKRSGTEKKETESDLTARTGAEKATSTENRTTASRPAEGKAYSGFMSRVQHWIGKDEQKDKETAI